MCHRLAYRQYDGGNPSVRIPFSHMKERHIERECLQKGTLDDKKEVKAAGTARRIGRRGRCMLAEVWGELDSHCIITYMEFLKK